MKGGRPGKGKHFSAFMGIPVFTPNAVVSGVSERSELSEISREKMKRKETISFGNVILRYELPLKGRVRF